MKTRHFKVSQFFVVSEVLYYLTNLFIFIGLIISAVKDVPNFFWPIGVGDLVLMTVQLILLLLVFTGAINRNSSMAILLILSVLQFQITAFYHSSTPGANVALQITITTFVSLLFTSVAAFTVSKNMALAFGGVNLIFFIGITLLYQDPRMMSEIVFFSVIVVGYSLAMYYFRDSLESLARGLYRSYETVKQQKHELEILKEKADRINEANRPFVVFGRNTSGLVHDFKNDIGLLNSGSQLLKMKLDMNKPVTHQDIADMENHINRLTERVETIKYVVSSSKSRKIEDIPIQKLIHATLYPFRLTNDLKNRILFEEVVEGEPVVTASRYRLVQVLENLIRNSCEAIIDSRDSLLGSEQQSGADHFESIEQMINSRQNLGKVIVEGRQVENAVLLAVEDNGPGITFCFDCDSDDCRGCVDFAIGKTTKSYGSGLGMVNVIETVANLRGSMRVLTGRHDGTRVELLLPVNSEEVLSQSLLQTLGFKKSPVIDRALDDFH